MFENSPSIDTLESDLLRCEALIASLRSKQLRLLARLVQARVATGDGCRSMQEWTASRLDIEPDLARRLVRAAGDVAASPRIAMALEAGEMTFDRAAATARLAAAGADDGTLAASAGFDISGVHRMTARRRRMTRHEERRRFRERYLTIQPNLDMSSFDLWGRLPGDMGEAVAAAIDRRADELPTSQESESRSTRLADALVSLATEGPGTGTDTSPSPTATIFVDASLALATNGEAGAELAGGPRVGPDLLDKILCTGRIGVVHTDEGRPLAASSWTRAIPPAVRHAVLWRDGGCAVDGCSSRYRLQPHHVVHRRHGGSNDPDNLVTLCWFHHHVVIHGLGYRIDADSPPQRRRFLPPEPSPDPPD